MRSANYSANYSANSLGGLPGEVIAAFLGSAQALQMRYAQAGLLLLVALINLAPLVGVLSSQRLEAMYGVEVSGKDMEILLRHRAVLFGIVGASLLGAIVLPRLRWPAMLAGLVSMFSFLVLAGMVGGYGSALRRIVIADVVGLLLLAAAMGIEIWGVAPVAT